MPSQSDLRYSFQPLVGNAEFEVVSFELREGISTPFELELKLISFENDIDFGHLLDKPVLFTIWEAERPVRYVHGLVSRFSQAESGSYRTYYHTLVEPQLARANLRSNWRIFQQKTVPQILELMLQRQGINQYELRASMDHQVREFCVQAGETDLAFIARIAAEEGFVYPGRYKRDAVGKPFTDNRITALRHDVRNAEVQGEDVRLQPGLSFTLTGHPRDNLNTPRQ